MKFTPLQLGFLAFHFEGFSEEELLIDQWQDIAQIAQDFIGLGDPFDANLVVEAVKFVLKDLPSEKNLYYFIDKIIWWATK